MSVLAEREQVIEYLQSHKDDISRRFGLTEIAVIGSFARNDFRADSDVDIIVRFQPNTPAIHELKQQLHAELEQAFGRRVEIASEKYLKPSYREQILAEAVYV